MYVYGIPVRSPTAGVTSSCELPDEVLGTELRSLEAGQAVSVLNHWAISSAPISDYFKQERYIYLTVYVLVLVNPLLPPSRSWGLNSGCQASWQLHGTEPSYQPKVHIFSYIATYPYTPIWSVVNRYLVKWFIKNKVTKTCKQSGFMFIEASN